MTEPDQLRLLAVHAHPDDESSKGAATMAKYVAEGARVMVATCTGGERGSVLNPAMDRPEVWERLPQIRVEEMARAREILGVEQEFLGFVDSGLPEGDPLPPLPEGCFALVPLEEAAAPLVALIRRFRPQVHHHLRRARRLSAPRPHQDPRDLGARLRGRGRSRPLSRPGRALAAEQALLPHELHAAPDKALHEAILATGAESPYAEWLANWDPARDLSHRVTTRVPCSEYFEIRDAALIAHATQIDPEGRWFACPVETQQRVWPTEDYELARSLVDVDDSRRTICSPASVARWGSDERDPGGRCRPGRNREQLPEDVGKSGPLGLLLTGLLLIAVVLLVKSMTRHLKRVPRASIDGEPDVVVPDTPAELLEPERRRAVLDRLRRAPRAIEPPRGDGDGGGTAR